MRYHIEARIVLSELDGLMILLLTLAAVIVVRSLLSLAFAGITIVRAEPWG